MNATEPMQNVADRGKSQLSRTGPANIQPFFVGGLLFPSIPWLHFARLPVDETRCIPHHSFQ